MSILTSIKALLGIEEDCTDYDGDIMIHINSVFMILNQLGVGPNEGFAIHDKQTTWDSYTSDDLQLESVKSYIYLKVKMLFDPPMNSIQEAAYTRSINELEWRLKVACE